LKKLYKTGGLFDLNTTANHPNCELPTVAELRERLWDGACSDARVCIASLFDEGTFVELGAYTMRYSSDISLLAENDNSAKNSFQLIRIPSGKILSRTALRFPVKERSAYIRSLRFILFPPVW
jgi:hypothetical protein